jgi:hypothetical protein
MTMIVGYLFDLNEAVPTFRCERCSRGHLKRGPLLKVLSAGPKHPLRTEYECVDCDLPVVGVRTAYLDERCSPPGQVCQLPRGHEGPHLSESVGRTEPEDKVMVDHKICLDEGESVRIFDRIRYDDGTVEVVVRCTKSHVAGELPDGTVLFELPRQTKPDEDDTDVQVAVAGYRELTPKQRERFWDELGIALPSSQGAPQSLTVPKKGQPPTPASVSDSGGDTLVWESQHSNLWDSQQTVPKPHRWMGNCPLFSVRPTHGGKFKLLNYTPQEVVQVCKGTLDECKEQAEKIYREVYRKPQKDPVEGFENLTADELAVLVADRLNRKLNEIVVVHQSDLSGKEFKLWAEWFMRDNLGEPCPRGATRFSAAVHVIMPELSQWCGWCCTGYDLVAALLWKLGLGPDEYESPVDNGKMKWSQLEEGLQKKSSE